MSYKTILVCLTTDMNAERLTNAAAYLARKSGAHLIGLHTLQAPQVYPGVVVDMPRPAIEEIAARQNEQAERIKNIFKKITDPEDFVGEWRLVKARSADAADRLVEHAHYADLVIMGQADAEHDRIDQSNAQEAVIKHSGRPVLVIPSVGDFQTIGNHALMGWSATREASRAIHDAIPLLDEGGAATIIWVSSSEANAAYLESTSHAVAACLDRHGIKATTAHWQNAEISIGDALLNESYERGADVIVTGAFGHSKFYDFVIGATTSHLLKHMTVPILFSH